MKFSNFIAYMIVAALASCTIAEPPVEEPVIIEEPVAPAPTQAPAPAPPIVTGSAPPPMPAPPVPDIVVAEEPEVVFLEAAPEPEVVIVEPQELPDEIESGELDFENAFDDIAKDKNAVTVFYGTNRELFTDADGNPIQSKNPEDIYSETPGPLHYGKALISIPSRHKRGRLETPISGRANNDKRYVVLQDLVHANYDLVMAEVQSELANAPEGKKTIVAYVHGFNTTFEKAARRAGQLKFDLDYDGPFFFFSWPSRESAFGYTHAANLAEISYTQMTEFLMDLTKQDADRIIIIAHSMGTRVLSHGLVDLAAQDAEAAKKITRVILAAPDIDARVFKERLLPKMSFLQNPITLYASDKDAALAASKKVNGLPRIGDVSGGLQEIDNVIMIDASDVKSNLLNHTYFGDSVSIVDDFKFIVSGPLEAISRSKTLIRTGDAPKELWKVRAIPLKP